MTTTMRVTHETKARLQRLQEEWRRRTGERPTLQHVIDALSVHGEKEPEHIIEDAAQPLSREGFDALHQELEAIGGWTGDAAEIDDVLYGA